MNEQQKWTVEDDYIYEGESWPKRRCIGRAHDKYDARRIADAHNATLQPQDDTKRIRNIVENVVRRTAQANCPVELNVKTAMQEFDAAIRKEA